MKRMASKQVWLIVCAVALLGALPAFPQAPSGPPAPSPEMAKLAFFAGDWTCKGKAEASPFGPAHATLGRVKVSKGAGGFWYVGRYAEKKTAENPHPVIFQYVQGYDDTAKALTMDCFDSFGSHCHQTSAGWQDNKMVFSGNATGSGPATPVRDTFTKTGDASLEHLGEMQVEGKWMTTDHETCTRAKK